MARAQNDISRGTSGIVQPTIDLNQVRCESTRLSRAIGVLQIREANEVSSSNTSSGEVSKIPYARSDRSLVASFAGGGTLICRPPANYSAAG